MAKGYWIVHVNVHDPVAYARYQAANAAPLKAHGGRFLARGGDSEVLEGASRARHVIIEFPSYRAALACYRSPEYQASKELRAGAGDADIVVLGGYEGPQPE